MIYSENRNLGVSTGVLSTEDMAEMCGHRKEFANMEQKCAVS